MVCLPKCTFQKPIFHGSPARLRCQTQCLPVGLLVGVLAGLLAGCFHASITFGIDGIICLSLFVVGSFVGSVWLRAVCIRSSALVIRSVARMIDKAPRALRSLVPLLGVGVAAGVYAVGRAFVELLV